MQNDSDFPEFPAKESRLFLPGPAGRLQAIATPGKLTASNMQASSANSVKHVAIVCHPHSLMGGTMNNKVVHTIARAHRDAGHPVIRFNFRGVEQSEGQYDGGVGESDDLLAVMAWAKHCFPAAQIWLAGFSFGSFVSARTTAMALDAGFDLAHLLLVAPAVENYPFDRLTEFAVPMAMIYGDQDEVVDPQEILQWFESVTSDKQIESIEGAGHFFHGRLTDLKAAVEKLSF